MAFQAPLMNTNDARLTHIGNKVFMVLFYLMTLGNLIPFILAYKYPKVVAVGYPLIIFLISMVCSFYVTSQTKKTGITAIDPDMLSEKESKQLHYPGLKAGLLYGLMSFFSTPLLHILLGESQDYLQSLLTFKNIFSSILQSFFFGVIIQIIISRRIEKAKKDQDED